MADQQNQNQNQGQGQNGGAQGQVREAAQRARDTAQRVGERAREGLDSAREAAAHQYRRAEGMIARNPGTSVLTSFGLGVGVGLVLGMLLTPRERSWYDRYVDEPMGDWGDRIGELADRVASRLRQVPDAIRDRMPGR
jgi:ElaB/YqjD/DUF883 family membrane-anchored ribosome-binding protein